MIKCVYFGLYGILFNSLVWYINGTFLVIIDLFTVIVWERFYAYYIYLTHATHPSSCTSDLFITITNVEVQWQSSKQRRTMIGFILAGSMGAVLNCALASYFSTSFDYVLQELFMTPLSTMKTVLPAVFGFFGGTLVLFTWHFLKARVLRFLLDYNGWFLHPRRKINKVRFFVYMQKIKVKFIAPVLTLSCIHLGLQALLLGSYGVMT